MSPFPLVEIILWLALFFAPEDAVKIVLITPEGEGELVRSGRGWSREDSVFWLADDTIQILRGEHRSSSDALSEYIVPVLANDWTRTPKVFFSGMSTFEKTADGFIVRINDGDPSEKTYSVRYVRAEAAGATEPAGTMKINVLGGVARPGVYALPAGARLIDAVVQAGGFDAAQATSSEREVTLVRGSAGHQPVSFRCGKNQADRDSIVANLRLQAHDTIWVSRRGSTDE